jgi:hypothetical protein
VSLVQIEKGEVEENFKRKDFMASEIVAIKRFFEPSVKETRIGHRLAKEDGKKSPDSGRFPKGRTERVVAKLAGVSSDTVAKAEKVVEAAEKNPEKYGALLGKVDSGKVSAELVAQKMEEQKAEVVQQTVTTPDVVPQLVECERCHVNAEIGALLSGTPCRRSHDSYCQA